MFKVWLWTSLLSPVEKTPPGNAGDAVGSLKQKIPYAVVQRSLCTTTTEAHTVEPGFPRKRRDHKGSLEAAIGEPPPLRQLEKGSDKDQTQPNIKPIN